MKILVQSTVMVFLIMILRLMDHLLQTSAVWESFTINMNPQIGDTITALSLQYDNAVFLNGVKLDLMAAACYGVGPEPLGREKMDVLNLI